MNTILAAFIGLVFRALAAWHFRMALSSTPAWSGSVPSAGGKPLFVPSTGATLVVGVVLLVFAVLVVAAAGLVRIGFPARLLSWACYAIALGLLARAIGECRYVGFFKRVSDSRFARLDSLVYSPLCLLLAVGVALVARAA